MSLNRKLIESNSFSLKKWIYIYNIVGNSPFPLLVSFNLFNSLLFLFISINIHSELNFYFFISLFNSLSLLIISILYWLNEILEESYFHNKILLSNLYLGFILFVISEIMLFSSFFITYFYNPDLLIGLSSINPFNIPLFNTAILYFSGISITISFLTQRNDFLFLTIFLGIIFTCFQLFEYYESSFSITDSFFGSIFYILTGFHGFHVLIGTLFLIVSLKIHHFLKPSILYWHFVDYVWLFLFISIYLI